MDGALSRNGLQGGKNISNSQLVGAQVIVVERFAVEGLSNIGWVATKCEECSDGAVKLGDENLPNPQILTNVLDEPLVDFGFVEEAENFLEVINKKRIGDIGAFW